MDIASDDGGFLSESDMSEIGSASEHSITDEEEEEEEDEEDPAKTNALSRHDSSLLPKNPRVLDVPTKKVKKRHRIRRRKGRRKRSEGTIPRGYYEFNSRSQVVGVTYLEIVKATDLPPLSNMTRTGFDMDPFVVVSFGKKTFRTEWRRHTLNPVFNETIMFPVLNHERGFSINFTIMDKDKFTLNDHVATADFPISTILDTAPKPHKDTLLYDIASLGMELPLNNGDSNAVSPGANSAVSSSEFDVDSNSSDSSPRRNSESVGSNGLNTTASSSALLTKLPEFDPSKPRPNSGQSSNASSVKKRKRLRRKRNRLLPDDANMVDFEIPMSLLKSKYEGKHSPKLYIRARFLPYAALRQQFWRGLISIFDSDSSNSMNAFEIVSLLDEIGATLSEKTVKSFFTRFNKDMNTDDLTIDEFVICLEDQILKDTLKEQERRRKHSTSDEKEAGNDDVKITITSDSTSNSKTSSTNSKLPTIGEGVPIITSSPPSEEEYTIDVDGMPVLANEKLPLFSSDDSHEEQEERLIRVKACPFCGQPRLNKKAEIDIVTHLATCASQSWTRDLPSMTQFVSSNHARKRWYTKMAFKVTYGNYKLGANSANILVQDRVTGFIQEEKMNMYVRLGIRLLYKGFRSSSMESRRIKSLLKNASIKQGRKYDSPASVHAIAPFVKFHQLDLSEVLLPLNEFKTFNQFFYRKLKPGARPIDCPEDERVAISPADCRSTYFPSVAKATEIWIKGKEFTIARLFGNAYPDLVDKFLNGPLAIFRLAPQDYHRFHIPVSGVLGKPKKIEGEYYTVNPMAIRSSLDVYGENIRVLVPIESEEFGTVMIVCVGAMMVGSTVITRSAGEKVKRGEELGYFQFGGSTLVVLFEPGRIKFDSDLIANSSEALETLVKVGMSIGHTPSRPQFERHDPNPQKKLE